MTYDFRTRQDPNLSATIPQPLQSVEKNVYSSSEFRPRQPNRLPTNMVPRIVRERPRSDMKGDLAVLVEFSKFLETTPDRITERGVERN
jgi:hypothetical protein